jgi:hypothetical protein
MKPRTTDGPARDQRTRQDEANELLQLWQSRRALPPSERLNGEVAR